MVCVKRRNRHDRSCGADGRSCASAALASPPTAAPLSSPACSRCDPPSGVPRTSIPDSRSPRPEVSPGALGAPASPGASPSVSATAAGRSAAAPSRIQQPDLPPNPARGPPRQVRGQRPEVGDPQVGHQHRGARRRRPRSRRSAPASVVRQDDDRTRRASPSEPGRSSANPGPWSRLTTERRARVALPAPRRCRGGCRRARIAPRRPPVARAWATADSRSQR